jgi:hypothetical protein
MFNYPEIARTLVDFGADTEMTIEGGCRALNLAADRDHEEVVEFLASASWLYGRHELQHARGALEGVTAAHLPLELRLLCADYICVRPRIARAPASR